jgi:hypothetical protein
MLTFADQQKVIEWACDRGYSDRQILSGMLWAIDRHPADALEAAALMVSHILYSREQLADGARFELTSLERE